MMTPKEQVRKAGEEFTKALQAELPPGAGFMLLLVELETEGVHTFSDLDFESTIKVLDKVKKYLENQKLRES